MNCWVIRKRKVCNTLNYIEHFFTLVFTVAVCNFISAFVLVDISKGIISSMIGLNIFPIIERTKKYKSIIKKKKKEKEVR